MKRDPEPEASTPEQWRCESALPCQRQRATKSNRAKNQTKKARDRDRACKLQRGSETDPFNATPIPKWASPQALELLMLEKGVVCRYIYIYISMQMHTRTLESGGLWALQRGPLELHFCQGT